LVNVQFVPISGFFFYFQDVLRCIGGMKIFLPLLEQISNFEPPKPSRIDSSEQLEVFDLEQSEAKTGDAIERYIQASKNFF